MKNASKHAAALKSLFRKLIRQHRPPPRPQVEPLRAIVMGVLAEQCDEARAHKAMEVFEETFVDINELRVATELELASMIGNRYPAAPERAVRMREILMSLFDAEGRLCIDRITAMNKKDQRSALRGLPMMTPFIEGYVSLVGLEQAAIPIDEPMRAFLVNRDALEAEASLEEAQRFLEAHFRADECWPFFFACRAEAAKTSPRRSRVARGSGKARRRLASK
jgi:endonuclease III